MPSAIDHEFDAQELENLGLDHAWQMIVARARKTEAEFIEKLVQSEDPVTRGRIQGIRMVLRMRETLLEEAKKGRAKQWQS